MTPDQEPYEYATAFHQADEAADFARKLKLAGFKVVVSSLITPVPKLSLSRFSTQASFSVVDDFNKFLLETFGTKEMCYVIWDKVVVSHATMEKLENWWRDERAKATPFPLSEFVVVPMWVFCSNSRLPV